MFFKIGVLKNSPIFSGKHLWWNLFFNKAPYISVFSLNARKYGPEKLRIGTIFTQCMGERKHVFWQHLVSV